MSVRVCVLLLISYTTRFGATVKQCMKRSIYDIPNICGDFRKKLSFKSFSSVKFVQKLPFSILLMSAQTVNY